MNLRNIIYYLNIYFETSIYNKHLKPSDMNIGFQPNWLVSVLIEKAYVGIQTNFARFCF